MVAPTTGVDLDVAFAEETSASSERNANSHLLSLRGGLRFGLWKLKKLICVRDLKFLVLSSRNFLVRHLDSLLKHNQARI